MARAARLSDGQQVSRSHGERDAHRVFGRFGLTLRIPISNVDVPGEHGQQSLKIPYLKVQDFFAYLLRKHPKLLFGGNEDGGDICQAFWTEYKHEHPEHVIYQRFPNPKDWRNVLPICLHGDKGRTLRKSPILILSWESVFGLPPKCRGSSVDTARRAAQTKDSKAMWDCERRVTGCKRPVVDSLESYDADFNQCAKKRKLDSVGGCAHSGLPHDKLVSGMLHNQKGSTFLTRFFFCALPSKLYKTNKEALPQTLREIASNIKELWDTGLQMSNQTFYCGFVGVKGDYEFELEAGQFTRGYSRVGTVKELAMCWECMAGLPGIPFTDVSDDPCWLETVGTASPWEDNTAPPLNSIPFGRNPDPTMYRRDPFHTLKFGFARDLSAGIIIQLCDMGYFDSPTDDSFSLEARLARAYGHFDLYCLAESKQKKLKSFTRENLKFPKSNSLPFLSAKGSDITAVLTWLSFALTIFTEQPLETEHRGRLRAMLQTTQGFLDYIGIMHSHGLFLHRCCAAVLYRSGLRLLRGYCYLSEDSTKNKRIAGYNLRPKLHYFHHSLFDQKKALEERSRKFILNPAVWNCEANEDYIGRLARISRRVDSRTCSLRTLQKYLVKARAVIARAGV